MVLVDRKKFEEQIKENFGDNPVVMGMILRLARRQKAVDAEPVRHGHWILYDYNICQCSACEQFFDEPMSDNKYCPNCGAKMAEVIE